MILHLTAADYVEGGGDIPESWNCVDCGVNTAPGCLARPEVKKGIEALGHRWSCVQVIDDRTEMYTVRAAVWERAGNVGGCLCIGCLEKRLGRKLRPKDFDRADAFSRFPGTPRLLDRRG
jgi:hypothetical protein